MSTPRTAALVLASSALSLALACGGSDRAFDGSGEDGGSGTSVVATDPGSGGFGGSRGAGDAGTTSSCAATVAKTEKAKVDIIFVIDDSGSMSEEMTQIRTNVNTFAQKIGGSGLDYTVTFIVKKGTSSTSSLPGALTICVPPPLAGANCADNPPTFHHVDQDVQSTDSFKLILSTYDSKNWKSYLRMEAVKVFVEVSDDASAVPFATFDKELLAKLPAGMFGTETARNYVWHSIISKPFADAVPSTKICPTASGSSVDYQELSKLTGGIIDEVCKTDYSAVLDNMAKGIVDRLSCQLTYPSAASADPSKLVVSFTPKNQAAEVLTQVTDASKCATVANAWYYDSPTKPTKILLCPSMCSKANAATDATLEALVGCTAAPPS